MLCCYARDGVGSGVGSGAGWSGDDKPPQRRVKKQALQDSSTVAAVSEMCFPVGLDISDCLEFMNMYVYIYMCMCVCQVTYIYMDINIYIYIHAYIYKSVYMSKYARYVSMSGLSCMQHDPNIVLASMRFVFVVLHMDV